MEIKFSINGQTQLSRNLRLLADNIGNGEETLEKILDVVKERTDDIFKSQGSIVAKNPRWKSLKSSTLRAREKRIGHYAKTPNRPGTMRWTGAMQDTVTKTVTKTSAKLEYTTEYAVYHQTGGRYLPKRAIIDLDNPTNNNIIRVIQESINKKIEIFGRQV